MTETLLTGTSYSAIPILHSLQKLGTSVTTCGSAPNDPCHLYSSAQAFVDYSNVETIRELQKQHQFKYLCPSCNDVSYNTCSKIAEEQKLPGFDPYQTTELLHNKAKFRAFTQKSGYPVPLAQTIESMDQLNRIRIEPPMLIKPSDSFSGRGVTKVGSHDDLKPAVTQAFDQSSSSNIVIEDFLDGTLHSNSAFIRNGRIFFEVFADEFCTVYPYQVNCSNCPSRLPKKLLKSVTDCMQTMVAELGLCDGLLHTQFMVKGEDFWIIECMRRSPGDLYFKMIEASTGVDCIQLYVMPFIGERYLSSPIAKSKKPVARHTVSSTKNICCHSYSFSFTSMKTQIYQLKDSGDLLHTSPFDKAAILIFEMESENQLFRCTENLGELITISSK